MNITQLIEIANKVYMNREVTAKWEADKKMKKKWLPSLAPTTFSFLWGRTPPARRKSLSVTQTSLFVAPAAWNLLEECGENEEKPARSSNSRFSTISPGRACAVPPPSAVGADWQLPKCSLITRGSGPRTPPGLGQRVSVAEINKCREMPARPTAAPARSPGLTSQPAAEFHTAVLLSIRRASPPCPSLQMDGCGAQASRGRVKAGSG
ncbi:PREDICTED: uncharacterized protein LOC101368442 [Odobenus rosmarus divergens]|uniref:Uncharacterized protein LOC101368442 n=1 Tax=Odobenus rosmarus divergens TaxID=9708 RepID=A0A2U3WCB9_ODORO|nr:PREDICTED: uncharacterized protein LOC101368442 [Odobenus rosmarus divergens]